MATIREQLDQILTTTTEELDQRERDLVQASEQLSQGVAVQAAFQQGVMAERWRNVALIDQQLEQLTRGGLNSTCLNTLRRMVWEVEAP